MEVLTPSNITFAIGIISTIFAVFLYFKNPQTNLEKKQAINEEKDKGKATLIDKERVEGKTNLIEEKLKWIQETNDKKFCEISKKIEDAFLLAANHTNTVDTKVDKLIQSSNLMSNEITRLATIIEERLPKKI